MPLACQDTAESWAGTVPLALPGLRVLWGTSSFSICLNLRLCIFIWLYFAKLCAEHPLDSRKSKEAPVLCFTQLLIFAQNPFYYEISEKHSDKT